MGSLELKGFICYSPQSDALSSAKTLREAFSSKGAIYFVEIEEETRSSWLNCALRDDEAVHWVSIGYCEALAIGN